MLINHSADSAIAQDVFERHVRPIVKRALIDLCLIATLTLNLARLGGSKAL